MATSDVPDARAERTARGRILLDSGQPATELGLRLYGHGFGDEVSVLAETRTGHLGEYTFTYELADATPRVNVEVRAVDRSGREVSLSHIKFDAAEEEVLNLVAPQRLQPAGIEYTRLLADVTEHLGDPVRLVGAREEEGRQDLRYLRRVSGWDARILALAVRVEEMHVDPRVELPRELLYALVRTGLPSDRERLALLGPEVVRDAVAKAVKEGLVPADTVRQVGRFAAFAERARRELKTPGTSSTYGELLTASGLSQADQDAFFPVWARHTGTAKELWGAAERAGVSAPGVRRLRLQGRLAHLTRNNAPLVQSVMRTLDGPDDLPRLVDEGFYKADVWLERLNRLADSNKNRLGDLVPPAFEGRDLADRLAAYTGDLAARIRLEYPSHVVRAMLRGDEVRLGRRHGELKRPVMEFLDRALPLGYRFGETPFDRFVADHRRELGDVGGVAVDGAKVLHRLYQVAPSHEGLAVLAEAEYTAAQDVAATDRAVFVSRHADSLGGTAVAEQVHHRAEQISAVTTEVVTALRTLDSAPLLTALSGTAADKEAAKSRIGKHYPALQQLFGSFDFCECDHCRSVLGPAAYLVDLLQLINLGDAEWKRHTDAWSRAHEGRKYPYVKPFDALAARRPDIQHTPLTCENTNTLHSQTDLFNEIAEFWVAEGGHLTDRSARDTGEAVTEDLLAEPQNVIPEAYAKLAAAAHPLTLPFDLWTETVRRFLGHLELSLAELAEAFRTRPELFPPAGKPYGRAAVLAEQLGLSPAEHRLLTGPDNIWFELYGYGTEGEASAALLSAKTLARRLDVTYRELVELLRTAYVNPALHRANGQDGARGRVGIVLRRTGVSLTDVFRYFAHPGYLPFDARQKADFEQRLDAATARYASARPAFDAKAWLTEAWAAKDMHAVLVLADPSPGCDFERTELRRADLAEAGADAFHRLNLFVRLRRRLGLPVRELDLALSEFTPPNAATVADGMRTCLVHLARLQTLHKRFGSRPGDRVRLLGLWALLAVGGGRPPYEELFLNPSVRAVDPVFDHPAGRYLSAPGTKIAEHLPGLRAALGLTAADIEAVLADDGRSAATADLTLDTVSLLHRHRILAERLGLTVEELIAARRATGIPPFTAIPSDPLADDAADPLAQTTLRFTDALDATSTAGFTPADLDHLLRHRADPIGPHRPDPGALLTLVLELSGGIARIRAEHPASPATAQELVDAFVVERLTAALPADADIVTALTGDARLLALDGARLVDAFTAAADTGVTRTLHASPDTTGPPVGAEQTVPEPNTSGIDTTVCDSARFSGYLQVPADGTYTFRAHPARADAPVVLRMPHLADPVLPGTGTVELRAGVPYAYTVEVHRLTAGHTRLLISGANAADEPLTSLRLHPAASIARVDRARVLMTKATRIAAGLRLTGREIRHVLTHRGDFAGLDLALLPTRRDDPAAAPPEKLFPALLALVRYGALRTELGASPDDLVDILERTRRSVPQGTDRAVLRTAVVADVCDRLAALLRRPRGSVQAVAERLGLSADDASDPTVIQLPGLARPEGLRRLWTALRLTERIGATPTALADWARMVEGDPEHGRQTAKALRDTVRGRFGTAAWRAVAGPLNDELRRLKRDALVAYIMHTDGFATLEEVYEHFLLDPGIQPVVRNSRIHAAIAAVQLFIQRCLMDLEETVEPAAVNSRWWTSHMSRYRVWEAARRMFLHPQRYLAPELRTDRSHLFDEAQNLLLQGDVDEDLVEQAFLGYLQGLERIAKLEIVSLCREILPGPPPTHVLHVIGRTAAAPHEYFHRTYTPASGGWSAWRPVGVPIEGDHVVAAVWRRRLHLLWVTFLPSAESKGFAAPAQGEKAPNFEGMAKQTPGETTQNLVRAQLSWIERVDGRWSDRRGGAFGQAVQLAAPLGAEAAARVTIHVTYDTAGGRDALKVNLGAPVDGAFRLVNKSVPPRWEGAQKKVASVYTVGSAGTPTADRGAGALSRSTHLVLSKDGESYPADPLSKEVLGTGGEFALVRCTNPPEFEDPFQGHPVGPFFYSDNPHSFLVEVEPRLVEYDLWVLPAPQPELQLSRDLLRDLPVKVFIPVDLGVFDPETVKSISPYARNSLAVRRDWLVNPSTVLRYGDRLVGQDGGLDLKVVQAVTATPETRQMIGIAPGSQAVPGSSVLVGKPGLVAEQKFTVPTQGVTIIGGSGVSAPALAHLDREEGIRP
ncbi:neuraminidase-like domain-containing protein [Streptomyces shaanxiensis]|uniref:Virulence plasmid A protein n=1 Tax=Streptomyces shaanxiensis TaxID=653357 RepID=A0ABP7UET3_9ACTN